MKRIGYLYEQVYDIDNIKLAIKNASKGKKKRKYVQKILANPDYFAKKLSTQLKDKTYKLTPNRYKKIYDESCGKERDITIPTFYPDQIIQWALCQVVSPYFIKSMYSHSYSAVKGRGIEGARHYIEKVCRISGEKYVCKMDLHKFFPSVNITKLKTQLAAKFKDKDLLDLFYTILDNGGEVGLPIGYYSSQWLSTFYLEELDRYIKEELHIKWYARYADDLVLIDSDKAKLRAARAKIYQFLIDHDYNTNIKPNWQIWPLSSRPIDFVGYCFYPNKTLLRKKTLRRIQKTTLKIEKHINIRRARRLLSLFGWARHSRFRKFYITNVRPVVSHKTLRRYTGVYYRRHKRNV